MEEKKSRNKHDKVRHPISLKLNLIISTIILLSLAIIIASISLNLSKSEEVNARQNLLQINTNISSLVEKQIDAISTSSQLFVKDAMDTGKSSVLSKNFFRLNDSIKVIDVQGYDHFVNSAYFNEMDLTWSAVNKFLEEHKADAANALAGKNIILNAWSTFNDEVLAYLTTCSINGQPKVFTIFFKLDDIISETDSLVYDTIMLNWKGDVLLAGDSQLIRSLTNYSTNDEMTEGLHSDTSIGQYTFPNPQIVKDSKGRIISGETYIHKMINIYNGYPFVKHKLKSFDYKFISFRKSKTSGVTVFTSVAKSKVFEGIYITTGQNILIALVMMFVTILGIFFYSKTLSNPILRLKKASEDIENGIFDIPLKPRGHDEITVLTKGMLHMAEGLGQKERLKKMFERFTNKAVAEKALSGELKLGGENKKATVFFSDIRNFTAMSEQLTPEEVISFLNDYMTRMVACVVRTGGIVDKFIGDSVMAVWGAPFTSGNEAEDALNAVKTALLMRSALIVFNRERAEKGLSPVKIGCGINSGEVVAGQMGSEKHKIEYTVLGDTVNFASRTESLNKPLGTDILITENTYNLIKDKVTVEEMPGVTVKGKTGVCRMFAVVNVPDCTDVPGAGEHGPRTLSQVREKLGISAPDLAKVNLNEEEKKYKVQGQ